MLMCHSLFLADGTKLCSARKDSRQLMLYMTFHLPALRTGVERKLHQLDATGGLEETTAVRWRYTASTLSH